MYVYILTETETGKFLAVYDNQKHAINSIGISYSNTDHTLTYRQVTSTCLFVSVSDIKNFTITKREVQTYSEHL